MASFIITIYPPGKQQQRDPQAGSPDREAGGAPGRGAGPAGGHPGPQEGLAAAAHVLPGGVAVPAAARQQQDVQHQGRDHQRGHVLPQAGQPQGDAAAGFFCFINIDDS